MVVLQDEVVKGQRRAAGKNIRRKTAICLDNYNIVLAIGTGDVGAEPIMMGKKFVGRLAHLPRILAEFGLNEKSARDQMFDFLSGIATPPTKKLGWKGMDKHFEIPQRTDDSTGRLAWYDKLKQAGLMDSEDGNEA